jgi:hypothetical protein
LGWHDFSFEKISRARAGTMRLTGTLFTAIIQKVCQLRCRVGGGRAKKRIWIQGVILERVGMGSDCHLPGDKGWKEKDT